MKAPPLSLYVHLPWCVRKCPYCDFNSWTAGDAAPRDRYLAALATDLKAEAKRAAGRELISIFLGGGTPSLFTPAEIGALLEEAGRHFAFTDDIEVTMEANPGTVECGDPSGYRAAGVNRLSIGAQSFSNESLQRLGRIHSVDDIYRAVSEARAAGFEQINIDLMFALPEQTPEAAVADIEAAVSLEPQHLSWYQLTLEPNTVFHSRPPAGLPDEDAAYEIQCRGQAALAAHGYEQYEVSAYARDGNRCQHNLNYWSFGDYLAVGAGAHGKLTDTAATYRYAKPAHPRAYMESMEGGAAFELDRPLDPDAMIFEYTLNALRLSDGFPESEFEQRTGLAAERLRNAAASALEKELIVREKTGRWRPTKLGRRFLNDLQAEFLP